MLFHNLTRKSDQLVVCASRFLNRIEHNYNIRKKNALAMVFSLHKFIHYLLGNKIIFYEDHMALVYLVNKLQISRSRWLLLFLEYDFIVMYKLGRTHVVTNALLTLLDITEPISALNQTIDANLFYTELKWLNDVKEFLRIKKIEETLYVQ